MMQMDFLECARKQFAYYKLLGDRTFAQVSEEELAWQYNACTNSIATIVKHLWGNMLSRWTDFLTTDGEKEWRDREAEFDNDLRTRAEVLAKWEEGWACLFHALAGLNDIDPGTIIHIRNEGHTVMEAINRQLAHYPYHVGQIVHIGKMLRGEAWQSLSIARGGSVEFNQGKFSQPKHRAHFTDEIIAHPYTIPVLEVALKEAHDRLWSLVDSLGGDELVAAPPGKWNTLQHAVHIQLGVQAMAVYLGLPKQIIREKFGIAERRSMQMVELKSKYYERLAQGVVPPDRFMPLVQTASDKEVCIASGQAAVGALLEALALWDEREVDAYLCPHPAMGLLTTREMLMFTVLHAEHHFKGIEGITT